MKPPGQSAFDEGDSSGPLTKSDLELLANPISVVHGYTQLLQRRIRTGRAMDDEEFLRVLGLIEQASRLLAARLIAIRAGMRIEDDEE